MSDEKRTEGLPVSGPELRPQWNYWFTELNDDRTGLTLKISKVLESTESEFQRIDVIENDDFGKLLVLYGSLMVADNDNNAYNEMLAHVPMFSHPNPEEVLIVGGGDCGTLTEVLRHPSVKRCTMCELDKQVVEVSRRHFPYLARGLDDPRANLVFNDGKVFVQSTDETFDIILLDLSDPVGPAKDLFQKPFHSQVYDRLSDSGIMVAQSESPYFNKEVVAAMYANLRSIFPIVRMYTCFMPIYPSGFWSFAFCSKTYDPLDDFDKARWQALKLQTRYYNAETHRASFALPQFCKDVIGE
jgi:spermidine synthase